jgi:hypothetical protein
MHAAVLNANVAAIACKIMLLIAILFQGSGVRDQRSGIRDQWSVASGQFPVRSSAANGNARGKVLSRGERIWPISNEKSLYFAGIAGHGMAALGRDCGGIFPLPGGARRMRVTFPVPGA